MTYLDKSLVSKDSHFSFRKRNKTSYVLNLNFNLLKDVDGRNIKVSIFNNFANLINSINKLLQFSASIFQKSNNVYKLTAENIIEYNVCEYFEKDMFGSASALKKYGNLKGCNITKVKFLDFAKSFNYILNF